MIGILASGHDHFARILADKLAADSIPAALVSSPGQLSITVEHDRSGHSTTRILSRTGIEFSSFVNRAQWVFGGTEDASFAVQEQFATLWAALALTSVPVLNRPTRWSFYPQPSALRRAAADVPLVSRDLLCGRCTRDALRSELASPSNLYQVRTGLYVGRLEEEMDPLFADTEIIRVVPFRRETVRRLLSVGRRLFDLNAANNELLDVSQDQSFAALSQAINSAEATLCKIVVDRIGDSGWALLHLDTFPFIDEHDEGWPFVVEAMRDYLT